ncbi:hypothetical protein [Methylotenera sp.]|uniref:hypothetical protein n=1 Tax=Methylotenera sp. TaxID=2051956 RepID=UPI002730B078|nr:hypothetical protein [Methylotenera sp.]MDP2071504.1 hypothetical protein [Methylotenera sp.]MDP2396648.1 hypothetical protein [bacterium]MDP3004973.1 hypothetical protein [Methylotenera sp.]MDP3818611.1 hypothetical protein [Methylotenera sp.]
MLGENAGLNLLLSHWNIPSDKLEPQIRSQLSYRQYSSNIGVLINFAKKYGYKPVTGSARSKLEPQLSNIQLEALLCPAEAATKLKTAIDNFFSFNQNTYISVTAGAGKTKSVISILADAVMTGKKVLFLAKEHKFGQQVESDLNVEILKRKAQFMVFSREKFQYTNSVIRIKGKSQPLSEESDIKICSNEELSKRPSIAPKDCIEHCYLQGECNYTTQFSSSANIRIMTHNEWFNNPSKWFKGLEYKTEKIYGTPYGEKEQYSVSPSVEESYWKPDYIVIDEDIMTHDDEINRVFEDEHSPYASIQSILKDLKLTNNLESAIKRNQNLILQDATHNYKTTNSGKYTELNPKYSEILACFNSFINSTQMYWLDGIYFKDDKLHINRLKRVAERYRNVPTLILDATANGQVIRKVYPNYKYDKIAVKSNSDINVYQMCNANLTKNHLQNQKNMATLITGFKTIVRKYRNVGLISYKAIKGNENFIESLANELGVSIYAHFGNLRGLNLFEDVDCLLIVGRYSLPQERTQEIAQAVYNVSEFDNIERSYLDVPVRMKSGQAKILNNYVYNNSMLQSIYEQKSIAETIQAVGRGRTIFGEPKDIFLFSNESLGADIEITEFFKYEDYFEKNRLDESTVNKLLDIGYIFINNKNIVKVLKEVNFTSKNKIENYVKNHKDEIISQLKDAGFRLHHEMSKCLVSNILKFEEFLLKNN